MIFSRVRRPIILIVILLLAAALLAACGGDDDEEGSGDSRPTVPSFPTTTTTPGGDEAGTLPTALPTTASGPTPTRFAGFPTLEVAPTIPSRYPNSIQIVSPVAGAQLSGTVTIWGSASHPDFIQYTLEYGPDPNPSGLWYPITPQAVTVPVLNNALGAWNTTQVQDGTYQLRLHVYLTGGREITNVVVTGLRVQNGQPQPTAPSNNAPIISPIAPLTLQRGTSATIALGIYDPDGDPTTFIAASDNTAVASVVPIGQSITVTGNSAGVATIRIRVSDDRGAIAETTFLTTVVQPQQANNPPNIDPVPGQTLTAGATINVPLTITDPDGDTVEFEVSSAAPGIASATAIAGGPSVQITGQTPGTTTVTVTARDARGASRAIAFSVVVNPATANDPPSIAAIPGQSLQEGDTKDIPLSISDPNGDSTSYQVSSNAPNVAGVSDLGGNRIRITGQNEGFASVTVVVEDNRGARASTVFSVTVNAAPPPNQNPTLGALQNQSLEIGQTIQVDLTLNDPDGDPLTVSSTSSDTAIATTGQADSDTLTVTGVGAGEATITVSVGDGRGGSDQETFNVQVSPATQPNQDPNLEPIGSQTVATGQTLIVPLDYSDPDNDNVTVFASSDAPGVASVFQSGPAELTITGASSGTATITVEIEDGRGGTATQSFPVTVEAVNQNPNIAPIPPQSCEAGDALTITLDYNDPDGDPVTANATSNATGVATTSLSDTTLTVDCVAEGVAMITVSVEDDQGGSNTTTFDVAVGAANRNPTIDQIAPQTCDAGDTLNLTLTYSDPDGDTVIPSASSNNPRIATVALQGDALTVNCVASGNATIVVEAEDTQGGSATMSFGVTIGDAAPVNQDPQINPIPPQMCQAGDSLSVDVTASDPDGDTVTLAATSTAPAVADATVAGNTLTINCVAEGTATINLTATDGQGGTATAGMQVTVGAPPNQDPQIDPIPPQTCQAGDAPAVTVTATDPDGDTVTLAATSTAPGVADATVAGTTLTINCVAEGTATINLTATDGQGGTATAGVQVTVGAPPNQDPQIDPIPSQTCQAGDTPTVTVTASDPDGDPVTLAATSTAPGVADATVAGTTLTINCVAEGMATINLTATDGQGGTAAADVQVTVSAAPPPNQEPSIDSIPPQTCQAGEAPTVMVTATDPDDDPVMLQASSTAPGVATVTVAGTTLTINCVAEGTATISVLADDGQGGIASINFAVDVTAAPLPNQSPVIDPIAPLELTVGQTVPVAISYSDPEDDPVTVTPTSDNPGIATVTQESEFQLSVTAVADGTATITVVVDDGQGGTNSTSFPVTVVGQAPPPFDITAYPDLPDLNALKQQLNPVYTDGINNQGKLPTAFSIAGDDSLSNANFLDPIAVGNYNLGNFSNLQTAIDHYNFAIQSVAVGSGWNVQTLLDPAAADPGLCDPGATPLDCELRRSSPVVIFISFAPSNATAVDVATFKSTLETIVDQSLGAGTIPVLATLPDDGTVDPATLAQYNQAIVEVATEHSAHPDLDVPLWNVYMTMQGAPQGVYAVAPAGAADFTDPSLTYGVNRRNWQALQILEAFRTTFP